MTSVVEVLESSAVRGWMPVSNGRRSIQCAACIVRAAPVAGLIDVVPDVDILA